MARSGVAGIDLAQGPTSAGGERMQSRSHSAGSWTGRFWNKSGRFRRHLGIVRSRLDARWLLADRIGGGYLEPSKNSFFAACALAASKAARLATDRVSANNLIRLRMALPFIIGSGPKFLFIVAHDRNIAVHEASGR